MKDTSNASTTPALDLRYDFEAIARLSESGLNLLDGISAEQMKEPAVYLLLVWGGLLHTDTELTPAAARAKLRGIRPRDVIKVVTDALARDIGASDEEKAAADEKKGEPAGSS